MPVEDIVKAWLGAVVTLRSKRGGEEIQRPAAFVFARPGGFGWLEPGYADAWPAPQPTWHEIQAELVIKNSGLIMFDGPEWSGDIEEYFGQGAGAPLLWFEAWLAGRNTTYQAERERVIDDIVVPAI